MTPTARRGRHDDRPDGQIENEAEDWIQQCVGLRPTSLEPLAPGLGHRRFLRVRFGDGATPATLILRIDPPDARTAVGGVPPEPELEPIRALLEARGLPVPRSHAHNQRRGWDLLEDVGDCSLEQAAAGPDASLRSGLYREALELLPLLQAIMPQTRAAVQDRPVAAFERRLDASLIETKARKVIEWLIPECLGRPPRASERTAIELAFAAVADSVAAAPLRLSHRDFKAANLHLRPALDAGHARASRLVLIDLQGAFMAPPEYDFVCLLRDSQVPLPEAEITAHLQAVRPRLPEAPAAATFMRRFDELTLTRVGKDLAHYLHAARERNDRRYLGFVAQGLRQLRSASAQLADEASAFRDIALLFADLPLPAICEGESTGAPPCAR